MRHILMSQQFDIERLTRLFTLADRINELRNTPEGETRLSKLLAGKKMFLLFYEESTRTRTSFWTAGTDLGMRVVWTEDARKFSSAAKGETLEHTIRILCGYRYDVIVLRHSETGAAARAAGVIDNYNSRGEIKPTMLVNAGDGEGQHPTQALLDLYTIRQELHRLDDLVIVIGGDLAHGRTCRSLVYLMAKFSGIRFVFISPPELAMRGDILAHLDEHTIPYRTEIDLSVVISAADVVYWTRIQRERLPDPELYPKVRDRYRIGETDVASMKPGAILMHPLPIAGEIAKEVDEMPCAAYFRQADNGLPIRMALLCEAFGVTL
jgi:aspartate carbamoyltransferase catalytic subunit